MHTGRRIRLLAIGTLFGFATCIVSVDAQEPFYQGKTIRLIVGLAPGGGYDLLFAGYRPPAGKAHSR